MTRVSQEELYNDKDVITQILKLKDTVNGYAGGIIENIDISGNNLVIDWEDGTSISLPLPDPVTGISSVTGNVTGGNLTITFYFTNGTTHSFTCPLSGMASETYVDAGLATKADDSSVVKLTGAQTVAGVKTFTDSPVVPDSPATEHSAVAQTWAENVAYLDDTVNNIVHKEGTEIVTGRKTYKGSRKIYAHADNLAFNDTPAGRTYSDPFVIIGNPVAGYTDDGLVFFSVAKLPSGKTQFQINMRNSDGSWKYGAFNLESDN